MNIAVICRNMSPGMKEEIEKLHGAPHNNLYFIDTSEKELRFQQANKGCLVWEAEAIDKKAFDDLQSVLKPSASGELWSTR